MSENCNQELGTSGDVSTSDDDSVSLLLGVNGWQNTVAVEDAGKSQSQPQDVIVPKKMLENDIFSLEKVEGLKCRYDHSSVANNESTSQSAKVSCWMRIPNKTKVCKKNEKGETLLFKACRRKDLAQVKMLIQAGINVNVRDYAGWTALHEAAAAGDWTVVEELLKAGAHINAQSLDGSMPLHDAVFCAHYKVVKLLLESGSSFSDRNLCGLTALEVAEKNIIDLLPSLQTVPGLSADQKQAGSDPMDCGGAGLPCWAQSNCWRCTAEPSCQTQLFCKTRPRPRWSYLTNVPSRASGDTEGARELGDIQLRKKDNRTGSLRHSQAITVILNELKRIQTDMSSRPQTSPEDAGRFYPTLTHVEDALTKVLIIQHLKMHNVAQKSRGLSGVRTLMWKNQLASLVSHQRNLVQILEKQVHLVKAYVNIRTKTSGQSVLHQNHHAAVEEESDHSSTPTSPKPGKVQGNSQHGAQFRQNPPRIICDKANALCTNGQYKIGSGSQRSSPQTRNTSQHSRYQRKGRNMLMESQCNKKLLELIKSGVMSAGDALRLWMRGRWHRARVNNDGTIRDTHLGKTHLTPEQWVESISGNNVPVSSQYAWDKVLFREKRLSHYLSSLEAEENTPQTRSKPEDADTLTCLMKIEIVHLVDDEEMLPNAVADYHWEKLLKTDYSVTGGWDN